MAVDVKEGNPSLHKPSRLRKRSKFEDRTTEVEGLLTNLVYNLQIEANYLEIPKDRVQSIFLAKRRHACPGFLKQIRDLPQP